ncbi:hypothetical protein METBISCDRAFT_24691 [Metschnikowia bicuspidata]|uniref:Uncharacterized protein n=1 Tax=Metschnikowia bicuspidata TaxID=27322 RepID=A0A4P9Z8D7_9ASCO|nr:hypothetical protein METBISCDRAFT_24691 [Metschnikowia bicuspidata]
MAKKLVLVDKYLCGYVLLVLGGSFVFISCFQLAKIAKTVLDDSGKLLNRDLSGKTTGANKTRSVYEIEVEQRLLASSGGIIHGYTVTEKLKSPCFGLMAAFTTVQMLRINFFVATIKAQELYFYKGEALTTGINYVFDLALPAGGIAAIPFIGLVLVNITTLQVSLLSGISVVIGVAGCFAWLPATYAGIVLMCLYRPFFYIKVSYYCAKVFGFDTFGSVYGTLICFSGLCNILQLEMNHVIHGYFTGDPVPVNATLTGATVVCAGLLVGFVRSQERAMLRHNLEREAKGVAATALLY